MSETPGVAFLRNASGEITHVTIDVQRHKAVLTVLEHLNLIEKEPFDEGVRNGYSIETSRQRSHDRIDRLWQK